MNTDFGLKHLVGLAWLFPLIAIVLVLTLNFRKKQDNKEIYDLKVIRYTLYFMWFLEVIKTIRIFRGSDFSGVGVYPAFMLPFHICSMALYTYIIMSTTKKCKFKKYIKPFNFATMLIVTLIILVIPASSGILGPTENWYLNYDNILPYQSFLYHGSLVFVPLYMVISGFYRPKVKDLIPANITLLIVALFAFVLNKILKVTDFMMLEYGNGNPFQDLLTSNYGLYLLILFGVGMGGTSLVLLLTIGIQKIFKRK